MKRAYRLSPADIADLLLCRPAFGIPFFLAVLSLVFFLSFCGIAQVLADQLLSVLLCLGSAASDTLREIGVSAHAVRYLIDGVYTAVASALAFLPQTVIFFFAHTRIGRLRLSGTRRACDRPFLSHLRSVGKHRHPAHARIRLCRFLRPCMLRRKKRTKGGSSRPAVYPLQCAPARIAVSCRYIFSDR